MDKAVGYCRTSSLANVGDGKHSLIRQREAIASYAVSAGYDVASWFIDQGVSGTIAVNERPGFSRMLEEIQKTGANTIIIEDANRFARDLIVQLVGYDMLTEMGITIIAANSPNHFKEDTPTGTLVRQVLGAIAEFEKSQLVHRLKKARDAKAARGEKAVGRKALAEKLDPQVVEDILTLRARKLSFAMIAKQINAETGLDLNAKQVDRVVKWKEAQNIVDKQEDNTT